ncbi:MAG: 4Fe-4S dicluster domain-containing protein [Candidatus Coatesbacteria bacterium]|nr:MAG: 4Fe-4S dicluster domain-containing protein [Candidatus Coatesbacteria bacterium]
MEKTLKKDAFAEWLKKLPSYDVYVPVEDDGRFNYEIVGNAGAIDESFTNAVVGPKKVVFPQREVLLRFNSTNEKAPEVEEVLPEEKPAVVFGVRPCDARAVTLTDKVFGGDFADPYYWRRRNNTTLIGLVCTEPPSANCFCTSVGGSPAGKDGLDVVLTSLGDRYYVETLTTRGEKVVSDGGKVFGEPAADDKKAAEKVGTEAAAKVERQVEGVNDLTENLRDMFDSPFWDEESLSCIRCGICTYLCPTCHCFDINDEVLVPVPLTGERVRTWDNCQFPDFTMHSSGHNPRPNRASRLRQRILHKFRYFVENFGDYQCTGCGRCIIYCPVGIDIVDVLDKTAAYER